MSNLEIHVDVMEGKQPVTVIRVVGEIDANTHQELDAKTEALINDGARHIVLDLTENKYMSSAGFRSMHKIYKSLKDLGDQSAAVKLVNPTDEIKRLMKAMGFETFFPVFEDLKEAVNAF